jgi:DNA repair exonuclease SbcCD ATPase subunit
MRIRLINFRCYIDKTFEFDDNSLCLISAESGAGKSTILMGIQFCLYGTGTKLQHNGKTSCSVEINFEDMHIIRTKRPNRLVLNDIYEDEVAQNIINKKFGDAFNITSYIPQNPINSFILMNPTDKLEFLEKFAFKDINLQEIKNKAKNLISERNEELNKTIAQIDITKNILEEMEEPIEIKFPFKCKTSDYEKITKSEENKVKNSDIGVKKSKNIILKTQEELNSICSLNSYINSKKEILDTLCEKMENLKIEEEVTDYIGDDELDEYKYKLENILINKELKILDQKLKDDIKKLEEMKKTEIEKYEKELENINCKLWNEYTKEDTESSISEIEEIMEDIKRIKFLENQINNDINEEKLENEKILLEKLKNDLDINKNKLDIIKKQKTIYSCPSCHNKLRFNSNQLYISEDNLIIDTEISEEDINKEIIKIQKKIKILENSIPNEENKIKNNKKIEIQILDIKASYEEDSLDYNGIKENLDDLKNYYDTQLKLELKKKNIEESLNNNFSSSYKLFEKDVEKLKNKVKSMKEECVNFDEKIEEEYLRKFINDQENNREKLIKLEKYKEELENDNKKYKKQLDDLNKKHIQNYEIIRNEEDLKNIIKENEEKITDLENKKGNSLKNLEQIEKFNKYLLEKDKFKNIKNKLKILEEKEKDDKKKYTAALIFKENVLEAESIAIQNIIESINNHAQVYLDYFFSENPMIVKLLSFKETKKNSKPQINLEIDYKGMEADLTTLSGGETSRLVLAFTLALSEMFNTPMLLLDESTASLNQELTSVVFDSIKENFKSKTIIVVAHQVVEGVFDKILKLNNI